MASSILSTRYFQTILFFNQFNILFHKLRNSHKNDSFIFQIQPVPTPSYLVALVVGFLEERKIGPRSSGPPKNKIIC